MENFLKQLTIDEIDELIKNPTEQVVSLILESVKQQEAQRKMKISGLIIFDEEAHLEKNSAHRKNDDKTSGIEMDLVDDLLDNIPTVDAIHDFEQSLHDDRKPDQVSHYVYQLKENLNKLVIVSKDPDQYEELLEEIYMETGLIGTVVEELREVQRPNPPENLERIQSETVCNELNKAQNVENTHQSSRRCGRNQGICVILDLCGKLKWKYRTLPSNGIYIDVYSQKEMERAVAIKRPDITYVSVAKFLDSERKTRYNTLVNEGNVNRGINKGNKWLGKLFGRYRKRGKKDGN